MASVAIPMVAGFAAQKLATDVLGVDPKMAAVLGMAAGGGAGAWASGGGSLGSLFGNTAGSAVAGQGASTIGQNMFGQTAGMAGMSPKVGGGLLSAAGTTGGAIQPQTFTGFSQPMSAAYNSPQTFTGVNAPFSSMASGNGYAGNPYMPIEASNNPYISPYVGNADAPADLMQMNAAMNDPSVIGDMQGGMGDYNFRPESQGGVSYRPSPVDASGMPFTEYDTMSQTPIGNFDQVAQPGTASNVGADRMGQTNYVYPNNSNAYNTSNISNSGRSMYDRSGYPVDPSLRRNYGVSKYGKPNPEAGNLNLDNLNYQADDDMYTAQLFREGNTVSGSSVANDIPDFINKDALLAAEMPGNQLDTLGYERATASLNSPTTPPQYPEYDAYARASHGMDEYAMQAVANTQPQPKPSTYNPGPAEATGVPPLDPEYQQQVVDIVDQSQELTEAVEALSEGDDKVRWWDKAENQQFLMQAASILLSDDIEEQQVSSGGGGGGGPPSPGVYSGGSSPAPKVVFGMGGYNGQGQQGYNPREIM